MKANDLIKVHIYGTDNREIKTRNFDRLFTVYEKNGKLGIDWNTDHCPYLCNGDEFTPFEIFSHIVIFEKVTTGKKFYFDSVSNRIKKVAQ